MLYWNFFESLLWSQCFGCLKAPERSISWAWSFPRSVWSTGSWESWPAVQRQACGCGRRTPRSQQEMSSGPPQGGDCVARAPLPHSSWSPEHPTSVPSLSAPTNLKETFGLSMKAIHCDTPHHCPSPSAPPPPTLSVTGFGFSQQANLWDWRGQETLFTQSSPGNPLPSRNIYWRHESNWRSSNACHPGCLSNATQSSPPVTPWDKH